MNRILVVIFIVMLGGVGSAFAEQQLLIKESDDTFGKAAAKINANDTELYLRTENLDTRFLKSDGTVKLPDDYLPAYSGGSEVADMASVWRIAMGGYLLAITLTGDDATPVIALSQAITAAEASRLQTIDQESGRGMMAVWLKNDSTVSSDTALPGVVDLGNGYTVTFPAWSLDIVRPFSRYISQADMYNFSMGPDSFAPSGQWLDAQYTQMVTGYEPVDIKDLVDKEYADAILNQVDIESFGFVTGAHTVDTDTQLSDGEVKTSYENNANTNAFTDSEKTFLGSPTGSDTEIVTGTAGTKDNCAKWNADGDLIDSGDPCGVGGTDITDLETLTGAGTGATDYGDFTGGVITSNQVNKDILQELSDAIEGLGGGHDAVTINATANGLSVDGSQVLTMGLSSTSTIGALSDTDWDIFNNKSDFDPDDPGPIGATPGTGNFTTLTATTYGTDGADGDHFYNFSNTGTDSTSCPTLTNTATDIGARCDIYDASGPSILPFWWTGTAWVASSGGTDDQDADEVDVDASGFSGNLDTDDTDVQTALDSIDALNLGSGDVTVVEQGTDPSAGDHPDKTFIFNYTDPGAWFQGANHFYTFADPGVAANPAMYDLVMTPPDAAEGTLSSTIAGMADCNTDNTTNCTVSLASGTEITDLTLTAEVGYVFDSWGPSGDVTGTVFDDGTVTMNSAKTGEVTIDSGPIVFYWDGETLPDTDDRSTTTLTDSAGGTPIWRSSTTALVTTTGPSGHGDAWKQTVATGQAAYFDSTAVNLPNGKVDFWVYLDSTLSTTGLVYLLSVNNQAENSISVFYDVDSNYLYAKLVDNAGFNLLCEDWANWAEDTWKHVEVTYDIPSDLLTIHVDDSLFCTASGDIGTVAAWGTVYQAAFGDTTNSSGQFDELTFEQ